MAVVTEFAVLDAKSLVFFCISANLKTTLDFRCLVYERVGAIHKENSTNLHLLRVSEKGAFICRPKGGPKPGVVL